MDTQKVGRTRKAVIRKLYLKERAKGVMARIAIDHARTLVAWDKANGETVGEFDRGTDAQFRDVRLRVVSDIDIDLDNLFGDTFNPKVNLDIPESRLERERKAEIERVNRDGVWGIQGQYFDGERWQTADSCYGFIGEDWKDSGYDFDAMNSALQAAKECRKCKCCGRPIHTQVA